jgi:hypothetical protein
VRPAHRLAPVAIAGLLGCGLLRFEVTQEASTVVEGVGLLGGVLGALELGGLDDFDVTVEQELEDQDVEPGDLRSVRLTQLTLTGDPELGFLSGLDVYVSADGLEEVLVATIDDVPDGQTTAELRLLDANLADAVIAGGMTFRLEASGEAPEVDTTVDAFVAVEVEATAKGACRAAGG